MGSTSFMVAVSVVACLIGAVASAPRELGVSLARRSLKAVGHGTPGVPSQDLVWEHAGNPNATAPSVQRLMAATGAAGKAAADKLNEELGAGLNATQTEWFAREIADDLFSTLQAYYLLPSMNATSESGDTNATSIIGEAHEALPIIQTYMTNRQ